MKLNKVSAIDYDKKDCEPVTCPYCQALHFAVFRIEQKKDGAEHLHMRCQHCDLTWCPDLEVHDRGTSEVSQ